MKTKKTIACLVGTVLSFAMLAGCGTAPGQISEPVTTEAVMPPTERIPAVTQPTIPKGQTEPGSESEELSALRQEIRQAGCSVGIAYVGFGAYDAAEKDLRELLNGDFTQYSFLKEAPLADCGGQELYALIPAGPEDRISIFASQLDENMEYQEDRENPVLAAAPGQTVLLRCNVSDIMTNSLAVVEGAWGSLEFRPCLSLRNGRVHQDDDCYDFTPYPGPDPEIAYELLREAPEVRQYLDQGMTILDTGEYETIDGRACVIFALGTDQDGAFVRERYYGVADNVIYTMVEGDGQWRLLGAD